MTNKGGSCC
ncbi:hypothetical protein Zm00014a_032359 [Zea mays]|uniref:Uncharacterized protein n=1 Tax=Zea mays TaxID=4577 RepID=A0A3L6EFP5_MAIZE|nr:hypothetical protein Zm00014a_032359 [Zea mays]